MSDKPKITEGPVSVSVDRVEAIEKQAKFIKRLTNPSPLIEYTEYQKLKAENERLMRERDSYAGYAKLNDELMEEREALKADNERLELVSNRLRNSWREDTEELKIERDTIKAKLAEVEAERDECIKVHDENINLMREFQKLMNQCANELEREREVAKVKREALESIAKNKTEDCEIYTMGCDCDQEAHKALAKADEIRGNK